MVNLTSLFILTIISVIVILNIIATYIVFKTYFIVKERRYYQTIFIWLIPFIGSILAIYINRQEYFEQKHKTEKHTNISDNEAFNYAMGADDHGGWNDQ